jgi:RNA polymerase sigma factor (sigma-70 family)
MTVLNEGFRGANDSRAASAERNVQLQKCLATLPEMQRAVIERAYLQGFTLREVSIQLDIPLGTVKSALSRGLARLRSNASEDLPDWAAS